MTTGHCLLSCWTLVVLGGCAGQALRCPEATIDPAARCPRAQEDRSVSLRKLPYPYRDMLAILSDVDDLDRQEFEGIHRFLNTEEDCGALGPGVGLDVGDTFWMGLAGEPEATPPTDRWLYHDNPERIRRYLQAGWIDATHALFQGGPGSAVSRDEVKAALGAWSRDELPVRVWVDHAANPWNLMFYRELGLRAAARGGQTELRLDPLPPVFEGDELSFPATGETAVVASVTSDPDGLRAELVAPLSGDHAACEKAVSPFRREPGGPGEYLGGFPSSPHYCADLLLPAGLRFFWSPMPEALGRSVQWGKLGFDSALVPRTLPDGQRVWGFMRYYDTPHTSNSGLATELDALLPEGGLRRDRFFIVATHLGYSNDLDPTVTDSSIPPTDVLGRNAGRLLTRETVDKLRWLRAQQDEGQILVARTSRLLQYNRVRDLLGEDAGSDCGYTTEALAGHAVRITVHQVSDPLFGPFVPTLEDLRGLTFYCDHPEEAELFLADQQVPAAELQVNPGDHTGRPSLMIRWFPFDRQDHTAIR